VSSPEAIHAHRTTGKEGRVVATIPCLGGENRSSAFSIQSATNIYWINRIPATYTGNEQRWNFHYRIPHEANQGNSCRGRISIAAGHRRFGHWFPEIQ